MATSNNSSPLSSSKKQLSYHQTTVGNDTFREHMKQQFQKKINDAIDRKEISIASQYESKTETRKQYANNQIAKANIEIEDTQTIQRKYV